MCDCNRDAQPIFILINRTLGTRVINAQHNKTRSSCSLSLSAGVNNYSSLQLCVICMLIGQARIRVVKILSRQTSEMCHLFV
jgi:hypothetical protein